MINVTHDEALRWKLNPPPGASIRVRNGVLHSWPAALGPVPTQAEVEAIEAEWLAAVVNKPPPDSGALIDARLADDPFARAVVRRLAADAGLPEAAMIADLKIKAGG